MLRRRSRPPQDQTAPTTNGSRPHEEPAEDFKEMELWEHLAELRARMIRAAFYVAIGALFGWFLSDPVIAFFQRPLEELTRRYHIIWAWTHITEPFFLKIKVSVIIGFAIAFPLVLGEVWGFVAPGLTRKERRVFYSIFPLIVFFFTLGCAVGYLVLWPALQYFASFLPPKAASPLPPHENGLNPGVIQNPATYLMFCVKMILSFGIVFQLPVILMGLAYAGVVNSRWLVKNWRTALVGMAALAAVLTPSGDALTMSLMLAPLILLYFGSILMVKFVERRKRGHG